MKKFSLSLSIIFIFTACSGNKTSQMISNTNTSYQNENSNNTPRYYDRYIDDITKTITKKIERRQKRKNEEEKGKINLLHDTDSKIIPKHCKGTKSVITSELMFSQIPEYQLPHVRLRHINEETQKILRKTKDKNTRKKFKEVKSNTYSDPEVLNLISCKNANRILVSAFLFSQIGLEFYIAFCLNKTTTFFDYNCDSDCKHFSTYNKCLNQPGVTDCESSWSDDGLSFAFLELNSIIIPFSSLAFYLAYDPYCITTMKFLKRNKKGKKERKESEDEDNIEKQVQKKLEKNDTNIKNFLCKRPGPKKGFGSCCCGCKYPFKRHIYPRVDYIKSCMTTIINWGKYMLCYKEKELKELNFEYLDTDDQEISSLIVGESNLTESKPLLIANTIQTL